MESMESHRTIANIEKIIPKLPKASIVCNLFSIISLTSYITGSPVFQVSYRGFQKISIIVYNTHEEIQQIFFRDK
jgi:hypothetical protein